MNKINKISLFSILVSFSFISVGCFDSKNDKKIINRENIFLLTGERFLGPVKYAYINSNNSKENTIRENTKIEIELSPSGNLIYYHRNIVNLNINNPINSYQDEYKIDKDNPNNLTRTLTQKGGYPETTKTNFTIKRGQNGEVLGIVQSTSDCDIENNTSNTSWKNNFPDKTIIKDSYSNETLEYNYNKKGQLISIIDETHYDTEVNLNTINSDIKYSTNFLKETIKFHFDKKYLYKTVVTLEWLNLSDNTLEITNEIIMECKKKDEYDNCLIREVTQKDPLKNDEKPLLLNTYNYKYIYY